MPATRATVAAEAGQVRPEQQLPHQRRRDEERKAGGDLRDSRDDERTRRASDQDAGARS